MSLVTLKSPEKCVKVTIVCLVKSVPCGDGRNKNSSAVKEETFLRWKLNFSTGLD